MISNLIAKNSREYSFWIFLKSNIAHRFYSFCKCPSCWKIFFQFVYFPVFLQIYYSYPYWFLCSFNYWLRVLRSSTMIDLLLLVLIYFEVMLLRECKFKISYLPCEFSFLLCEMTLFSPPSTHMYFFF